ncbi:MaoC family dehydratase [Portibacter marinus]|uniref:MaoC family dehydratase n=1 Tax=Portibacter marinus TaxID=2898660 RepID=UPI001F288878|nr:MaoC family dehydratase [Portibacter marinus]
MEELMPSDEVKKTEFNSIELSKLRPFVGHEIGVSPWHKITQQQINEFAKVTMDQQWIHVDEKMAEEHSPFGKTIAHGYLVLSLIPRLTSESVKFTNAEMGINYGLDKVRFTHPVISGSEIRARTTLLEVIDVNGGVKIKYQVTIDVNGEEKPACVAQTIALILKKAK